jgi:hypothetical protein
MEALIGANRGRPRVRARVSGRLPPVLQRAPRRSRGSCGERGRFAGCEIARNRLEEATLMSLCLAVAIALLSKVGGGRRRERADDRGEPGVYGPRLAPVFAAGMSGRCSAVD